MIGRQPVRMPTFTAKARAAEAYLSIACWTTAVK